VDGPHSPAYRRRQRTFDGYDKIFKRLYRLVGKRIAVESGGLFSEKNLAPPDFARFPVCLGDGSIPNLEGGPHDVRTNAVAFDITDGGPVGHVKPAVPNADFFAA